MIFRFLEEQSLYRNVKSLLWNVPYLIVNEVEDIDMADLLKCIIKYLKIWYKIMNFFFYKKKTAHRKFIDPESISFIKEFKFN